jgi:hypothetical protein
MVYTKVKERIKAEFAENIATNGTFSITLDAWTAINQKAYLGITM